MKISEYFQHYQKSENDNEIMYKISKLQNEIKSLKKDQKKLVSRINKRAKIVIATVLVLAGVSFFLLANNYLQPKNEISYGLRSNYEIEDLKGDIINTWVSWYVMPMDLFHIHVLASPLVTDERMKVIRDVIFSDQTVTVNGQTYYKGWHGALQEASHRSTKLSIPLHLHTVLTETGTGNIVINLTDLENPDGLTAKTKSIADVGNHQILKSEITVYQVDKLSDTQLALILRHELGHGFGLAHSDDPDDLMHGTINEDGIPYISECDIEALVGLYNGNEKSEVICQK